MSSYCDRDDIEDVLSATGVDLRIDDNPPDTLGEVIERASADVFQYCGQIYTDANILNSNFIRYKCADIATFYLCERRGNAVPAPLFRRYQEGMEFLKRVAKGQERITGIPMKSSNAPTFTKQRVVLRPYPNIVTERQNSTDAPNKSTPRHDDPFDNSLSDYSI